MDHPYPWLRYVDAGDVADQTIDFDGMKVRNDAHEKLGDVDGFIVDSQSGRPYYVVVDAGGWFKTKQFLLPVGHARLDHDNDAIVADLPKDRINRFPGFDKDDFDKLKDEDFRAINDQTSIACSTTAVSYPASDPYTAAWDRPDFSYPTWWNAEPTLPSRMGENAFSAAVEYPASKVAPPATDRSAEASRSTEHITARDRTAHDADPSPHFDGRAQPGDVLGVETGGEQTHIGEDADDENKRRRDAERAARKDRS